MVSSPSQATLCSTHHTSQLGLREAARGLSRRVQPEHEAALRPCRLPQREHATASMLASSERHLPVRAVGANSPDPVGTMRCGKRGEPRARSRNAGAAVVAGDSVAMQAVSENLRSGLGSGTKPATHRCKTAVGFWFTTTSHTLTRNYSTICCGRVWVRLHLRRLGIVEGFMKNTTNPFILFHIFGIFQKCVLVTIIPIVASTTRRVNSK